MTLLGRLSLILALGIGLTLLCLAMGAQAGEPHHPPPPVKHNPTQTQVQNQGQSMYQGQAQTMTQGNSQTSNSGASLNANEVKQAPDVFAPSFGATAPCLVGGSAGISLVGGSITGGTVKVEHDCALRETARAFAGIGQVEIAYRILCATDAAKAALTECPPYQPPQKIGAPGPSAEATKAIPCETKDYKASQEAQCSERIDTAIRKESQK